MGKEHYNSLMRKTEKGNSTSSWQNLKKKAEVSKFQQNRDYKDCRQKNRRKCLKRWRLTFTKVCQHGPSRKLKGGICKHANLTKTETRKRISKSMKNRFCKKSKIPWKMKNKGKLLTQVQWSPKAGSGYWNKESYERCIKTEDRKPTTGIRNRNLI